ncbi:hypothetical protein FOBRF1_003799 [Fusarium oxysporum]
MSRVSGLVPGVLHGATVPVQRQTFTSTSINVFRSVGNCHGTRSINRATLLSSESFDRLNIDLDVLNETYHRRFTTSLDVRPILLYSNRAPT